MIILQATHTNEIFYYIEVVIVILVILLQIVHSFKLYGSIQKLRTIFIKSFIIKTGYIEKVKIGTVEDVLSAVTYTNEADLTSDSKKSTIKITLVDSLGKNEVILRIKQTLNSYLVNNYGAAVNFSIIKDIIDREVDVRDDEISQSIPTPLYLGLAATMIGIIFGLLAMPELNGNGFANGINALIDGVKLAMVASLTGLLSTTLLSSYFYKRAKRIVLRDKNDQLSYLQAKLLPELVRAEDTGVSGLKASLDRFAREATKISDNVIIAANQTGANIEAQLDVISKVENLDMLKVSRVNMLLFERLEKNMISYEKFFDNLTVMELISTNLKEFVNRTDDIQKISTEINSTLNESRKLTQFLTSHFNKIENMGNSALKAVDLSDSYFKNAIIILQEETDARISALNSIANIAEKELKETFEDIGQRVNDIAKNHLDNLKETFENSSPKLKNLEELFEIKRQLQENNKILNLILNQRKLIMTHNDLNDSVQKTERNKNNYNTSIINETITQKHDNIELIEEVKPIKESTKLLKRNTPQFKPLTFSEWLKAMTVFKSKNK